MTDALVFKKDYCIVIIESKFIGLLQANNFRHINRFKEAAFGDLISGINDGSTIIHIKGVPIPFSEDPSYFSFLTLQKDTDKKFYIKKYNVILDDDPEKAQIEVEA